MTRPDPKSYWTDGGQKRRVASSNAALFRFFGNGGFTFAEKSVLEVGFGYGADLLEAQRRGARIYGLDISAKAVEEFRRRTSIDTVMVGDASKQPFAFDIRFDAIFSNDTLYYMTDMEIGMFARHCRAALAPGGRVVVHFIQSDWKRPSSNSAAPVTFEEWTTIDGVFAPENPIRLLDPASVASLFEAEGFTLTGTKTFMETYGVREEILRVQRYLMFSLDSPD